MMTRPAGAGKGRAMASDPMIRQLRRLLEMGAAAGHGMSNATLGGGDPAETAFIEEELDRMGDIHRALAAALDKLEAGADPAEVRPLVLEVARLREPTPWASSELLDRFIDRYGA